MSGTAAAANGWDDETSSYAAHLHLVSGEAVHSSDAADNGTVIPLAAAHPGHVHTPVGDGIIYAW